MSKLVRFANTRLVSKHRLDFMREPVFMMADNSSGNPVVSLNRLDLLDVYVLDPKRTARRLSKVCEAYGIDTVDHLFEVGFGGLSKCEGAGEALLWMAAHVVQTAQRNILEWIDRESAVSKIGAIRTATRRAKGRKDPRPGSKAPQRRTRQRSVRHRG